ncbi:MAG: glutathione S-transferase [Marivibrio sp.]|uniref:glutathione S-transferase family protein n=1 Tax=Marivibrio sp. TaxID=2039719 RepID=UPI0032EAAEE3
MYRLYYYPDTASLAPHMCLLQAGAPHRLALVDQSKGDLDSAAFRAISPHGRVPAMFVGDPEEGGYALIEAAALCLKIAEDFPESGLLPAAGTKERAQTQQWLIYLTNTLQADLMVFNYARRYASTPAGIKQVKAESAARIGSMLGHIDRHLKASGGPFLVGSGPTAADYFLLMLAGWCEQFEIPDPPSIRPTLLSYLRGMQQTPAAVEAYRIEGHGPYF